MSRSAAHDPRVASTWRPALSSAGSAVAVVVVLAALVWLEARSVVLASAVAAGLLGAGAAALWFRWLPRIFLTLLGVVLLGYAVAGRGFAYLGVPPLFVGELVLVVGAATLFLRGELIALLRAPLVWILLVFMAIGAAATLPHLGTYGLDAVRDAAQWGYATFALIVAGLVTDERAVRAVVGWYRRVLPWLMLGALGVFLLTYLTGDRLPLVPLSHVPIVVYKGGDVAVHLAGVLAFVVLGLHRAFGAPPAARDPFREWWWWLLWLAAWVTSLAVRASFVVMVFVGGLLFALRPGARWWRLLVVGATLVALAAVFDLELAIGRQGRPISVAGVVTTVQSILEPVGASALDGTRQWRLNWWRDIVGYTLLGDLFWTGKGYGINLADADGYQVHADRSLRSPHNGHLTILARSGVPGAAAWLALNAWLAVALFAAYRRRLAERRVAWAHLNLWLLAYWLAFVTNASFDVYLEGPMGGVWFWSTVGFAIAALRVQRALPATDDGEVPVRDAEDRLALAGG